MSRRRAEGRFPAVPAIRHLRSYIRLASAALGTDVLAKAEMEAVPALPRPQGIRRDPSGVWISSPAGGPKAASPADALKILVRRVAEQYGITVPRIAVRFVHTTDFAGSIRRESALWYVDVASRYQQDPDRLVAIIAHEMAHAVLLDLGVSLPDKQRDEELTDATAVLAGFGSVMLRAYDRSRSNWKGRTETHITDRIGYLHIADIRRLHDVRCMLAEARVLPRRAPIDSRRAATVSCWACGGRLRLPDVHAAVQLRCRECGGIQRVKLVGNPHRPWMRFISVLWWAALRWVDRLNGL